MNPAARNDLFLGLGALAGAAFLLFYLIPLGIVRPGNTETRALAPDFWPIIIVEAIAFAGICLVALGWIHRDKPHPEAEDAAQTTRTGVAIRVVSVFVALLASYFLIPVLGLVLCAIVLCALLLWLGGERRIHIVLGVSVLLPVLLYLFFNGFAGVPIPTGLFEGMLDGSGS